MPGRLQIILSLFFFVTALLGIFPAAVHALEKITFSWQANPPHEQVLGYRLYYGSSSRYTRDGVPKTNFTYEYYLDYFNFERCLADGSDTNCEKLDLNDMRCENLLGDKPSCTIYNLPGKNYFFAMTAYNAETESGYTNELSIINRGVLTATQIANALLFKKKENK
jgi:hypothetical protein